MKRKVIVNTAPKGQMGALNKKMTPWLSYKEMQSEPNVSVKSTLEPVDRKFANLEAEKGEVATIPGKGGIPNTFKIGGNRHVNGGTPLNLPPDSFIYSDTKAMRIKDPAILAQFGMGKGAYTPADIAKKYDINKFKKILLDPDTDDIQRSTAEGMIANYNLKLAKLALLQESMKGFPQSIPVVAIPYIEQMNMDPTEFTEMNPAGGEQPDINDAGEAKFGGILGRLKAMKQGGPQVDYFSPKKTITTRKVLVNTPIKKYQEGGSPDILNNHPVYTRQYNLIENTFKNDPEVKQALYEKTIAALKDPKNQGKHFKFTQEQIDSLTPDSVANAFTEMQKRNLGMQAHGHDVAKFKNSPDKGLNTNKGFIEAWKKMGVTQPDAFNAALQQASYIGYRDILDDRNAGKFDKELTAKLEPFTVLQKGAGDESKKINTKGTISPIDAIYTNTTAGEIANVKLPPEEAAQIAQEAKVASKNPATQADHIDKPDYKGVGSPWWLQDIIKTAHAAGNLARIKKYQPWQATPNIMTPDVTFFDPTRELAANSEQANIATQSLAQFTGPQAFNARFNEIQGQGIKNAADILSRYNNQNVQISNEQAANNANIMNQASQQKAALATSLWDKYQTVNQMFDNSKSQARDALVSQYINAITNKNYTANLNKINPQFAVDPSIGGEYYFHDPRAIKPDFSQNSDIAQMADDLLAKHPAVFQGKPELAWKAASQMAGINTPEDTYMQPQNPMIPQPYPGQ